MTQIGRFMLTFTIRNMKTGKCMVKREVFDTAELAKAELDFYSKVEAAHILDRSTQKTEQLVCSPDKLKPGQVISSHKIYVT